MHFQDEITKTRAFAFKNWIMAKRNVFTLVEVLFWPVVAFLSVGLLAEFAELSREMKGFILIGVVSMSAVQVCQLDVSYALLYDVWSKAVKHGFIAPVGIRHLLLGSFIIGVLRGAIVFVLLGGASYFIFDFDFLFAGWFPLSVFCCGLFLSGAIVGLSVWILVLTLGNRAEVAAWSMVSLMLLVCGIYYPVSMLPKGVSALAELIPVTYFLEYFRQFYGFRTTFSNVLVKGYGLVVLYFAIEVALIQIALRRAKRKGLLLKLSE